MGAFFNQSIDPHESLLFLDEIQAVPELFAKLRWFAEDLPELAVIAAGSLLDFIFDANSFSMPVGRITYMHMEPMSFEEFLLASEKAGKQIVKRMMVFPISSFFLYFFCDRSFIVNRIILISFYCSNKSGCFQKIESILFLLFLALQEV